LCPILLQEYSYYWALGYFVDFVLAVDLVIFWPKGPLFFLYAGVPPGLPSSVHKIDKERVVWGEMDGEALLLDLVSGAYFSLDELGKLIWEKLGEGQSEEEIVQAITSTYNVDEATSREDLKEFLGKLQVSGLLQAEEK